MYATAERAPIVYCLGVVEHSTGTEGVMALSNLALAAGKLGRPGCGINPLRGQNNVQGACDMGAGPADFTGYQKVANPEMRAKFEAAWGVELNRAAGLKATECFPAMIDGRIRGLFLFGEGPDAVVCGHQPCAPGLRRRGGAGSAVAVHGPGPSGHAHHARGGVLARLGRILAGAVPSVGRAAR